MIDADQAGRRVYLQPTVDWKRSQIEELVKPFKSGDLFQLIPMRVMEVNDEEQHSICFEKTVRILDQDVFYYWNLDIAKEGITTLETTFLFKTTELALGEDLRGFGKDLINLRTRVENLEAKANA